MGRRLSNEEVKQISLRMKSSRMLTGLTQEKFATENNIPLMSLKCWEMGRAVPRKEGISNYLNAIRKSGIEVTLDWIFHGSGPGPTYSSGTQVEKPRINSSYIEQQVELFKKNQLSRGLNPIVTEISDDDMAPLFKNGDLVGGAYSTIDDILSCLSLAEIMKTPWLLMLDKSDFIPRFLVIPETKKSVFYKSNANPAILEYSVTAIGQICWHYSLSSIA